jgi:hypothetical protein
MQIFRSSAKLRGDATRQCETLVRSVNEADWPADGKYARASYWDRLLARVRFLFSSPVSVWKGKKKTGDTQTVDDIYDLSFSGQPLRSGSGDGRVGMGVVYCIYFL